MKTAKNINYRALLILIISSALFLIVAPKAWAANSCSWRAYTLQVDPPQILSAGCFSDEDRSGDAKCSDPKPAGSSGLVNTEYFCCCQATQEAATKEPKFKIPELQIDIPTLKLSEVKCQADDSGNFNCPIPWIGEYIVAIYNYGVGVAGILAAIMLMAGGVLWLISGGDSSKVSQAKELIAGSVTGIIILMSSYILLLEINPKLVTFKPISLNYIKEAEVKLASSRYSSSAQGYKDSTCASETELANGVNFYATGYYKPRWEETTDFWCIVAMQCSCPNGIDKSKTCDHLYGKTFPGYHPCQPFPKTKPYCNMTASGKAPALGDIAGPGNCQGTLPYGTKVCFKGKTYTITDTGGGIKGRRIDIWSGDSLKDALANTGVGTLTKGPCPN